MSRTMTMRIYKATARKVHETHTALSVAVETAEHSSRMSIGDALRPMQEAVDALRVQVCSACNHHGDLPMDADGWTHSCKHPDVPVFDVRTGAVDEERTRRAKVTF